MTRRSLIILILLVGLLAGGYHALNNMVDKAMRESVTHHLAQLGFKDIEIGQAIHNGEDFVFLDIGLDPERFSKIGAAQMRIDYKSLLLGQRPSVMTLSDVELTGNYSTADALKVSGWSSKGINLYKAPDKVSLQSAKLDLLTSAGGIRLQCKGESVKQPNGSLMLQGITWAAQNQLKFEADVNATVSQESGWLVDLQLKSGGLNLDNLKVSRISGWFSAERTKSIVPVVSGQIDAGRFSYKDLSLMNFRAIIDGPYGSHKLLATGDVAGYENMQVILDIQNTPKGPQIAANLETNSSADLIRFLRALSRSDTEAGHMTSLLLTEGNIQRLEKSLNGLTYNTLELQISGTLYDLLGKIVVKTYEGETTQRRIISLDPGTDN